MAPKEFTLVYGASTPCKDNVKHTHGDMEEANS